MHVYKPCMHVRKLSTLSYRHLAIYNDISTISCLNHVGYMHVQSDSLFVSARNQKKHSQSYGGTTTTTLAACRHHALHVDSAWCCQKRSTKHDAGREELRAQTAADAEHGVRGIFSAADVYTHANPSSPLITCGYRRAIIVFRCNCSGMIENLFVSLVLLFTLITEGRITRLFAIQGLQAIKLRIPRGSPNR